MKLHNILMDNDNTYVITSASREYLKVLDDLIDSIPEEEITGYELIKNSNNIYELKLSYNNGEIDEVIVTKFNNEYKIRSDRNKKTLVVNEDNSFNVIAATIYKAADNYVEKIEILNIDEIPAIGMCLETINNSTYVEDMPSLKGMGLYRYKSDKKVNLHVSHVDLSSGNEFKNMEMYGDKVIDVIKDFDNYNNKRFEEHNKNLKK